MYMDKKNNKIKRSFVPQAIGDTIRKVNRNYSSKFGKIEFIIHSKWSEITGAYFGEFSEPKNITRIPDYENEFGETVFKNQLNVSVAPAAALEFQHYKDTIIEKINSYFGYKAIIDLRIQQNYIPKTVVKAKVLNDRKLTSDDEKSIINEVEKLKNDDLKQSLIDLGTNITKDIK